MSQRDLPHARPTSTSLLTAARIAALGASIAGGLAIGAGILPNALAEGGINVVVAGTVPVVVTVLLATLWHGSLGYAAHASSGGERGLAALFGFGLFSIGGLTSAWFMVAILSGPQAQRALQRSYLDELDAKRTIAVTNHNIDTNLLTVLSGAATNLDSMAAAEAQSGSVSGRTGCKVVCSSFKTLARAVEQKLTAVTAIHTADSDKLDKAREAIASARRAVDISDKTAFDENLAAALEAISATASTSFVLGDIGTGLDTTHIQSQATRLVQNITAMGEEASRKRRAFKVPAYEAIDAKTAVLLKPQPAAWIAAAAIEGLPFLLLCLLLTVWRAPAAEAVAQSDGATRRSGIRLVPGE